MRSKTQEQRKTRQWGGAYLKTCPVHLRQGLTTKQRIHGELRSQEEASDGPTQETTLPARGSEKSLSALEVTHLFPLVRSPPASHLLREAFLGHQG